MMKLIILFCITALSLSFIECGFKKVAKFQETPLLDSDLKAKIQQALSNLPADKIPKQFKEPKDDKWDFVKFNINLV